MDILAQCGFSPCTVEDARRFYKGQITRSEFLTIFLKINKAYSYDNNINLPTMIQALSWVTYQRCDRRPSSLVTASCPRVGR